MAIIPMLFGRPLCSFRHVQAKSAQFSLKLDAVPRNSLIMGRNVVIAKRAPSVNIC
jgi:hypothetical protein